VSPITAGQVVVWSLPPELVSAGVPLCLGLFPQSTNGADYMNLTTASPPRLVVEYQ
jgi:hypothetical protein